MTSLDIAPDVRPAQPRPQQPAHQAAPAARRPVQPAEPKRPAIQPEARRAPPPAPKPWWFAAPAVLKACFKVATAPLVLAVMIAELIMAALVLGIAGAVAAWWFGWITDAQILEAAKPIGDRLMSIIQSLGYL